MCDGGGKPRQGRKRPRPQGERRPPARRGRVWDTQLFPQCREVRKRNSSEQCRFVRGTPDCRLDGGFLDYLGGAFCTFPSSLLPLSVSLYVSAGTGGRWAGDPGWGMLGHGRRGTSPPAGALAPLPLRHPRRDGGEVVSSPGGARSGNGPTLRPRAPVTPLCALPASAPTCRPSPPT